jgi:manganese/iron transport system permease protein
MDLPALVMAPLQFELTRRALLEVTLVGLACGALGVLVVLRGLSFIGDALGHCVVPGVVVAYLLHGPLELWGGVAAVLSAWAMALLGRHARNGGDTAIAVVFTTLFALGLGLISASGSYLGDLTEILFGNVLSVDLTDLAISAATAALIGVVLAVLFRPLVLVAFDPGAAAALGLPRGRLDLLLYALIAAAIVSGAVAAGSLLVTALVVVPAATARLLARDVRSQMLLAGALGCLSGWSGLYASYYWRLASGGTVIIAATLLFLLGLLVSKVGGCLARRRAPPPLTRVGSPA